MRTPQKTSLLNQIGTFFEIFGSAASVAYAVENGRSPKARHLNALGIDPDQFRSIGKV